MTITSVSNENGIAGTTITINGTNLIGITQVIFPGNIQGTNITSGKRFSDFSYSTLWHYTARFAALDRWARHSSFTPTL